MNVANQEGTARFTVLSGGKVGVNNSAPGVTGLSVTGDISGSANIISHGADGLISGSSTSTGSFGDLSIDTITSRNHASTGRPGLTQIQGGTDWAVGIGTTAPSTGALTEDNPPLKDPTGVLFPSIMYTSFFIFIKNNKGFL